MLPLTPEHIKGTVRALREAAHTPQERVALAWRPWHSYPEWREYPGEEHRYVPTVLGMQGSYRERIGPGHLAATSLPNIAGVLADLVALAYDGSMFSSS
jgi:hypothetical protein